MTKNTRSKIEELLIKVKNRIYTIPTIIGKLEDILNDWENERMYITENDLKSRLLTAKIEVLDDILNEVRRVQERETFNKNSKGVDMLTRLYRPYTDYRTTLKKERNSLKQEK